MSFLTGTELINVTATDNDIRGEHNKFFFSIDSVTPEPDDMEFFINKEPYFDSGTISFKGCLNRKVRMPMIKLKQIRLVYHLFSLNV